MADEFGEELLVKVPGFYRREKDGAWTIGGCSGLLIPVVDLDGQIVALKVRCDEIPEGGGKYQYLTSVHNGGPTAIAAVHAPLSHLLREDYGWHGMTPESRNVVRITEGELKSDLSVHLSGILTYSVPGVHHWQKALDALGKRLEPLSDSITIRVAMDADAHRNLSVALAQRKLVEAFRDLGYLVNLEKWSEIQPDGTSTKGIDDLLAAGLEPTVLTGDDVDAELRKIMAEAQERQEKEQEQKQEGQTAGFGGSEPGSNGAGSNGATITEEEAEEIKAGPPTGWPEPLAEEAFYGLAGEVINRILPHTEGDPAAILIQLLAAFGNAAGLRPYIVAGDRHQLRLFPAIIGLTNAGAKGTGWGEVCRFMEEVDPIWALNCVGGGLSSGEGLISAVRDPSGKDKGAIDKRLLAIETEFAKVLKMPQRPGNNISEQLRQAYESNTLRMRTKSPLTATNVHISVIGHITPEELRLSLTDVDTSNGFANRFSCMCSHRSKLVPIGGRGCEYGSLVADFENALVWARTEAGLMGFTPDAQRVWEGLYPDLRMDIPGLIGNITARRAPNVLRMAATYATLDCMGVIAVPHLLAAVAVWDRCAASAAYIFGGKVGEETADTILRALRKEPKGLPRTDISGLFSRHAGSGLIDTALELLDSYGYAYSKRRTTAGRPADIWFARSSRFGMNPLLPKALDLA